MDSPRWEAFLSQWSTVGKPLILPTFSAFLSFVFVVIRPLARLGGEYAFLVFTSILLFFFPTGNLIAQLEATVLGVFASALGLGWANATLAIAAYCGRKYGADSEPANAIVGVGLALWSLICGFVRSYAPRFTAATRIALFFPIFLLTANTGALSVQPSFFLDQFLVTCFAAAFALVPTMLFSYGSTGPHLGKLVLDSIHATSELLPLSLASVLDVDLAEKLATLEASRSGKQQSLSRTLKTTTSQLRPNHDRYMLEVTRARIAPASLGPLVKALRRINRNALLGPGSHVPGERIRAALERTYGGPSGIATPHTPRGRSMPPSQQRHRDTIELQRADKRSSQSPSPRPGHVFAFDRARHDRSSSTIALPAGRAGLSMACQTLVAAVQQALRSAAAELADIFGWADVHGTPLHKETAALQAKEELGHALSELQLKLAILLDDLGAAQRSNRGRSPGHASFDSHWSHERDHFRLAFYMTSLLDLAKDVLGVLTVAVDLSQRANASKTWYWPSIPGLQRLRFQAGPGPGMYETRDSVEEQDRDLDMIRQDEEDYTYEQMDFATATMYRTRQTPFQPSNMFQRIIFSWRHVWDDRRVVQGRIHVSKLLHSAKTSPRIYFAIKLAGGISLLSIPAYLSPNSRGRKWFNHYRAAWQIVSYMYVLETHTGAIFQIGIFRLAGTFLGAVAAYVCTLIARDNPYALVVLATVLTVPITWLIIMSPYPTIGVVAGITLPPLMFISYLGYANGQSDFELAWTRFVDIAIGIVAAVLVGSFIWPNHARVQYFRSVATTFDRASEYYLRMSRDLLRPSLVYKGNTKQYERLESDVRTHVATSRTLVAIQRKEISLLPRPIKLYSEVVEATERLIETLAEIRVLRFSVPRKSTVFDLMPLRTELISSISVNLWALNQSFKSRSPLPQHLPSPRSSLEGIMTSVEDLARSSRRGRSDDVTDDDSSPSFEGNDKLGVLYGMAENEAIGEVCTILEELVAAARTLFGTQTFLGGVTYGLPQQETA